MLTLIDDDFDDNVEIVAKDDVSIENGIVDVSIVIDFVDKVAMDETISANIKIIATKIMMNDQWL